MTTGYVSEIFCSIQGEGPLVGQRQVFFRTGGCSATCRWCDTVYSKVRSPRCVIHGQDGGAARTLPNPVASADAAREVLEAARRDAGTETVSITGGEPLEQGDFVVDVARRCKEGGLSVYLETNGLHDDEFARILPSLDVVAMDIKLPSATGLVAWKRHEAFLARLEGDAEIFVKVVVDDCSTPREIELAARLVASVNPAIPFVLQPESGMILSNRKSPEAARGVYRLLDSGRETAAALLHDVRVIPQVHKILDVR